MDCPDASAVPLSISIKQQLTPTLGRAEAIKFLQRFSGPPSSSSRQDMARQHCDSDFADRGAYEAGRQRDPQSALSPNDRGGRGDKQCLNHD